MKAHTKFQEAWLEIAKKTLWTVQWREYCQDKKLEKRQKCKKFSKPKIWVLGNVITKAHAKFQETSSIANTQKSRGTVQDVKIAKSKTGKTGKIHENFRNSKKQNLIIGKVIRMAHAKFQERNTQKSRGTAPRCQASDEDSYHPYYDKNLGSKSQILQSHNFRTRRIWISKSDEIRCTNGWCKQLHRKLQATQLSPNLLENRQNNYEDCKSLSYLKWKNLNRVCFTFCS